MGKVINTHEMALDTPRRPLARNLDTETLGVWQQRLKVADIGARCLPFIPYETDDEELIEAREMQSKEILFAVGGLMIAHSDYILEFDRSVLTHIEQAATVGVPVFTQVPLEEVVPDGWEIPPEVFVHAGFRIDTIKQRLEGEL
jgi:hypothetical protein